MSDTVIFALEVFKNLNYPQVCENKPFKIIRRRKRFQDLKNYSSSSLLTLNLICLIISIYALNRVIYSNNWPCFNLNDCVTWLLTWNHITIAIFIFLSSSTYKRVKTHNCFHFAEELIEKCAARQKISRMRLGYYYILLILIFIIKSAFIFSDQKYKIEFLFYSLSHIVPLSMEFVFLLLCTVVKDTCEEIRHSIRKLSTSNSILISWNLKNMIGYHLRAISLLRMISSCFDLDLLVDLAFNMVWFIVLFYQTIAKRFAEETTAPNTVYSLILEMIFLGSRVIFLSYSVSQIANEIRKINVELRNLECGDLSPRCLKLTTRFMQQVLDIEVKVEICGFFNLDMSFLRGVISLTLTYFFVFLQYGFKNQLLNSYSNGTNLSNYSYKSIYEH